jgi:sodium/bile acid cotransporter 7
MAVGLIIVSTMPCTLASATLWTRMAGGNDALALLITVGSNSLSFLAAPLLLALALGRAVALSPWDMMLDLLTVILLPVLAGQLLRLWPAIRYRADQHRRAMSLLGQCMILTLVITGIARAALQTQGQVVGVRDLMWVLGAVVVVHGLSLLLSDLVGRGAGLSRSDRMALLFGGSQKTLPAGLFVAQSFFPTFALASIPSLLYHASQLIIDSFVAEGLRRSRAASGAHRQPERGESAP